MGDFGSSGATTIAADIKADGLATLLVEHGPGTELEKKLNQILETQQAILRLLAPRSGSSLSDC
jgi:hypothetical protein